MIYDSDHIFPISTSTVDHLKKVIKLEKSHTCHNFEGHALSGCLWKTSIPVDGNFKDSKLEEVLSGVEKLPAVFPDIPLEEHLNVVVKAE